MKKIVVDSKFDIYTLIEQIKNATEDSFYILFKKDANLYRNSSNLKIIQNIATDAGKEIQFDVENSRHKEFIEAVNNHTLEYAEEEVALEEYSEVEPDSEFRPRRKFSFPKIKFLASGVGAAILLVGGAALFWYFVPSATVNINIDSDVLVRLIDVKASVSQAEISVEAARIPAIKVEVEEKDEQTSPTTGKKTVGEKAEGKVTL